MSTSEKQHQEALRRDTEREMWRAKARAEFEAQTMPGEHREEGVELWAHCGDPVNCDDSQERVIGIRVTSNRTYRENGGDGPTADYIENSSQSFDFASDQDRYCPRCGLHRVITDQKRPEYAPLSGYDPKALLRFARKWAQEGGRPPLVPGAVFQKAKPEDDRVAQLEQELADLKARLDGNGRSGSPVDPPAAVTAPEPGVKGYRKRGERYEALIYRSESEDGKQHAIGTFDTREEAVAAREAALS